MEDREKWFLDRIGKRVFRNKTTCKCQTCEKVWINGLVIGDEFHAGYLHEIESEYTIEGSNLRYFDTKKEAEEFERGV